MELPAEHPLVEWIVRNTTWLMDRFWPVPGSKDTSFELRNGRQYLSKLVPFAETVMWKDPGQHKLKLRGKLGQGIWVGRQEKNNAHLILTRQGACEARLIRRLPPSERADVQLMLVCRGIPSRTRPPDVGDEDPANIRHLEEDGKTTMPMRSDTPDATSSNIPWMPVNEEREVRTPGASSSQPPAEKPDEKDARPAPDGASSKRPLNQAAKKARRHQTRPKTEETPRSGSELSWRTDRNIPVTRSPTMSKVKWVRLIKPSEDDPSRGISHCHRVPNSHQGPRDAWTHHITTTRRARRETRCVSQSSKARPRAQPQRNEN